MGRLPDFLVLGAMKAGTTSLASYIDQHPDIAVSQPKELNFFADPGEWDRGIGWYASHFDPDAKMVGEASVRNTMVPEFTGAPERIAKLLPDVRLVYLVREPIARMRSMFIHRADKYEEVATSLSEAIERNPAYIEISRYDRQLQPYLDLFDESRLLVVTTDELDANPGVCVRRVFTHLGVDPSFAVDSEQRLNVGATKKRLGGVGYGLAWMIKRSGVRRHLSERLRLRIKHAFSTDFGSLELSESRKADVEGAVRPYLAKTRRFVTMTGAPIPDWLAD